MQESTKVLPSTLSSLVPKQSLRLRGITSSEKTAHDYELRSSRGPAVRGLSTLGMLLLPPFACLSDTCNLWTAERCLQIYAWNHVGLETAHEVTKRSE
jgi:hypothetical protein